MASMANKYIRGTARKRQEPAKQRPQKGNCNSVPFPQRERIKQKYIQGKNLTLIAKEEKRHRTTVAKIVKSEDVFQHVVQLREKFYGALDSILANALKFAQQSDNDGGKMAYQMLKDAGIIPNGAPVKHEVKMEVETKPEDLEQKRMHSIAVALVEGAIARNKFFGLPEPDVDERTVYADAEKED